MRSWYCGWRKNAIAEQNREVHIRLKFDRDEFMLGLEAALKKFNESERTERTIENTFLSAGQDWFNPEATRVAFKAHLEKLSQSGLYRALLEAQQQADLHYD